MSEEDLIKRLRERRLIVAPSPASFGGSLWDPLCIEAANALEELYRVHREALKQLKSKLHQDAVLNAVFNNCPPQICAQCGHRCGQGDPYCQVLQNSWGGDK